MNEGKFSFRSFYKRRAARLLPALSITLFGVLLFGFVFYNNQSFDNLGKELFFSSFGAVNILFSQGVNYFAKDDAYQPLIHLWSLGVEEQFYIIWPILLMSLYRFSILVVISVALMVFLFSFGMSVHAVNAGLLKGYFLLQYRAFELLVGVITAFFMLHSVNIKISDLGKQFLTYVGCALIFIPMFILDSQSDFPGFNALIPCFGAALIIAFPNQGVITKLLSNKILVFIGLISYPLYLYHQPIISFMYFFDADLTSVEMFLGVTSISVLASWLTFKFIEMPIRKLAFNDCSQTRIFLQ